MDGFVGSAVRGTLGCARPQRPVLRALGRRHRRDGLPRRARDPELLGVRAQLRAAGPHVRAERVVEPARASVPRQRVVGEVRGQGRRVELPRARRTIPAEPPDFRGDLRHTTPSYAWTDLTYLLHKNARELALLRREGQAARLRRRRRDRAIRRRRARGRRASGIRCRTSRRSGRTGSSATSRRCTTSSRPRATGTLPAVSWIVPNDRVSEHPPSRVSRRPGIRDAARERGDAQPRLVVDRDLPRVGRLGRLLRPRRPAEGRRRRLRPARSRAS